MDTFLTVSKEDLERLSPQEAVNFFRELLWAEARSLGIPISKVHVSGWTDVPDGGIDGQVEESDISVQSDLIKPGHTGYQIKASHAFKPWQDSEIREELFGSNSPSKENLGSSVKDCLEKNGNYVLVCFRQDLVEGQRRQALEALKKYFKQCDCSNPKVEVWSQNNIIGFLKKFPSLALHANRRGMARFQTHHGWSKHDDMKKVFRGGAKQRDFISRLQTELRRDDEAVHVRVWGEPGIGKTKFVFEATRDDDLLPLVIYCDSAGKFRDSDLMNEILRDDNQFSAILVIDECDPDSRSYIWNRLKHLGSRIMLISIYNEYDDTSGNIAYFDMPPLGKEEISSIIQGYGIPEYQAGRWADICSGSPRVAHVIGLNLKNNPEDLLKTPDTANVWERFISGGDDPGSRQVQERALVLRHVALFKRFGYELRLGDEALAIWKKVNQVDPSLTWGRFQEIIQKLKARKILQGEYTLYITPKALHIRLWIDWWNTYGNRFDFDDFSKGLSPTFLEWFYEMFVYASESEVTSRIAKDLLGVDGPFQKNDYLKTRLGARFFQSLAEAEPRSALEFLQNTVGTWGKEELLQFTSGQREVVWALEDIAVHKELFNGAARLLLALGAAENEPISNNAEGVFVQLFSPASGQVAPTGSSPEERFPILKEALESQYKKHRLLALRACDQALESEHFVRTIGTGRQGLKREPERWMPKTYGELFDAYRRVWHLIRERLDTMPGDEKQQAVDILLKRARGLGRTPNLADMVIDTISEFAQKPYGDKKAILAAISRILHYDGKILVPETRERWESLRDEMTGSDFPSLMRRYVGMDLLEDHFDEDGKRADQIQSRIESLAQSVLENKGLLQPELDWLVTTEAQNGYRFGYGLAHKDVDFSLLPTLLEAQRNARENEGAYFIGGYFRALNEKDPEKWEEQLDALVRDEKLNIWIPELTWRSGNISNRAASRLLDLAEKGVISVGHFRMFCFGGVAGDLSEDLFKKWINFLLDSSDYTSISIALDLYDSYYIRKESEHTMPEELTLKLLTNKLLFQKIEMTKRNQMDDFHWAEIGKAFLKLHPERSLELAYKMLEYFGEDGTILEGFHSQTQSVLNEITKKCPNEVWDRIKNYLGPPIDSRAFNIGQWLRGGEHYVEKNGALDLIPAEEVWKWVEEAIEKRAWYLANFVHPSLFRKEGKICLARDVLVRYGQREDVGNELIANFSTEGWSGPASLHYNEKKRGLLDFKKDEENDNVKRWIDKFVSLLDREIEIRKIEEEREGF